MSDLFPSTFATSTGASPLTVNPNPFALLKFQIKGNINLMKMHFFDLNVILPVHFYTSWCREPISSRKNWHWSEFPKYIQDFNSCEIRCHNFCFNCRFRWNIWRWTSQLGAFGFVYKFFSSLTNLELKFENKV